MKTITKTRHFKLTHAESAGEYRAHLISPEAKAWSESKGEPSSRPICYDDHFCGRKYPSLPGFISDALAKHEAEIDLHARMN